MAGGLERVPTGTDLRPNFGDRLELRCVGVESAGTSELAVDLECIFDDLQSFINISYRIIETLTHVAK